MDLLLLLKLVHVAGAILWVGGATIMTILAFAVLQRGDDRATIALMENFGLLGNKVFVPISLVVIASGLVLAWLAGWGFAAWTVLAFLTVLCTFALGAGLLGPSMERSIKLAHEGREAEAVALSRWTMRLVKLDLGGQWGIIALMVVKPGWTDPMLLVPALVLAVGAALFALDGNRRPAAQPA